MKGIILFGHGYIGSEIAKELRNQGITFFWSDHKQVLIHHKDDIVINAAGYTGKPNVDACEKHKAECIDGNIKWPLLLEQYYNNIPIIHIGSGCIYNSFAEYYFKEEDKPDFDFYNGGSFYSGCKALAEKLLQPYLNKSYILRIRIPFGKEEHDKNYLTKLKNYDKLVDVRNSISCVEDIAKIAVYFATELPETGIYNVVNSGKITTREVVEMMGLEKEWFMFYENFLETVKTPRSNCLLSNEKLLKIYPIRTVTEALYDCINNQFDSDILKGEAEND